MPDYEAEVAEMLAEATDMEPDEIIESIVGEGTNQTNYDRLYETIVRVRKVA